MKSKAIANSGFSLLELLVTLAVLALLVSLISTANQNKITKVTLMQVQLDLLALAAKMEEYKLVNSTYIGAAGSTENRLATGKPWIYSDYSPSSDTIEQSKYSLFIHRADSAGYELIAKPTSSELPRFGFNSKGEKYRDINLDGSFSIDEMCWKC